jgi:hypothetical protein
MYQREFGFSSESPGVWASESFLDYWHFSEATCLVPKGLISPGNREMRGMVVQKRTKRGYDKPDSLSKPG